MNDNLTFEIENKVNKKPFKPLVVFSGVNLIEGGPISIFKDAINAFIKYKLKEYRLVVFINNRLLFAEYSSTGILFIERKNVKKSYIRRLWFEYIESYFLSVKMKPFLWFALHDITPNVSATRQVVYCHNPGPFYKISFKEAQMEPTFFYFTLFYKFLYRINIKSNDFIVVQQNWIRKFFEREFKVQHVIVAHPNIHVPAISGFSNKINNSKFLFFYPALPRVFKNFEVVLEASSILSTKRNDFEVILTMKGNENKYARYIFSKYKKLKIVSFIGIQLREEVLKLYTKIDCLIFPSKLETWGLPISEIKFFDKPVLLADKPYSKETAGDYKKVKFFNCDDPNELSEYMNAVMDGSIIFSDNKYQKPEEPYSENWKELLSILLK